MNAFDLTGRLAVVTGARRGIGRATRALAEAGADVIAVSASLEESGSAVEKDVTTAGRGFEAIRADFSDPRPSGRSARAGSIRWAAPSTTGRGWRPAGQCRSGPGRACGRAQPFAAVAPPCLSAPLVGGGDLDLYQPALDGQ